MTTGQPHPQHQHRPRCGLVEATATGGSQASSLSTTADYMISAKPTNMMNMVLMGMSIVICVLTAPISLFFCFSVRPPDKFGGYWIAGLFFSLPWVDEVIKVDMRTVSMDVPPQEILTRDSVTVSVDAVVFYRVSNPVWSQTHVENASMSTRLLAQTTLRNMMGVRSLYEILTERDHITVAMQDILDNATDDWGIKVERVEVKDVRIPVNLQRAMAAEAEAAREAAAKVVAAHGELKASRLLRDAADQIALQPQALQLRYLQSLNLISAEKNHSIIFPIPMSFLNSMANGLQALEHLAGHKHNNNKPALCTRCKNFPPV